jgi:hypothetical protein
MNQTTSVAHPRRGHPLLPPFLLRAEAAVGLALWTTLYARSGGSWWLFALLFFTPDVGILAYLAGAKWGAVGYNLLHTYSSPAVLALIGVVFPAPLTLHVALIWAAHIAFDRLFGYGLKFPEAFGATHLGQLGGGRRRRPRAVRP